VEILYLFQTKDLRRFVTMMVFRIKKEGQVSWWEFLLGYGSFSHWWTANEGRGFVRMRWALNSASGRWQDVVISKFLVQRLDVDPQEPGRLHLFPAGILQDPRDVRPLHLR